MSKMQFKYWAGLLFALASCSPQFDPARKDFGTYYFEGEDVVFEFDRRIYESAVRSADKTPFDFEDLGVLEVAVAGNFNNWSGEGWTMERVDDNHYRLRKHLRDFKDTPDWQFRFVINGALWPDSSADKQGALNWYNIKNPNAPVPVHGDTGNVVFHLRGFGSSRQVILTGSFNNWDESAIRMKPAGDAWDIHLTLAPGVYEYKFIADGKWLEDPANPEKRVNQYGTFNSVLRVRKPVRFILNGFPEARQVILAGSFNDWNEKAQRMLKTDAGWQTEIPLEGGKHLYKFIVDGRWMTDPANRRSETDPEGNVNSVLFVR